MIKKFERLFTGANVIEFQRKLTENIIQQTIYFSDFISASNQSECSDRNYYPVIFWQFFNSSDIIVIMVICEKVLTTSYLRIVGGT